MKKQMLALALACLGWRAAEGKAPAAAREDPSSARQSYEAQVKAELAELDSKIDALESQAQRAGARSRDRLLAEVKAMRAQKRDADKRFEGLKAAAGRQWEDVKEGLDRALLKLKKACRRAASQLGVLPRPRAAPASYSPLAIALLSGPTAP